MSDSAERYCATSPLRVGLVGAGPWARLFHAPMIASGPATELVAVWARNPNAARELAAAHGATAQPSYQALLEQCDAVVFAVPPDIQARLAPLAARAGKALLLEKPLGLDLEQAQGLTEAIQNAGVVNQVMFTNRYTEHVRLFLAEVATRSPIGAIATFVNGGALPGETFATPWRIKHGAILDLGPHMLDLIDEAVGPIAAVSAVGDPRRWVAVTARHHNGAVSQASFSLNVPRIAPVAELRIFTEEGDVSVELGAADALPQTPKTVLAEFVSAVTSGKPHRLDVARALHVQRLMEEATHSLSD
jgi:predicted dehydrogenase